MGWASHNDGGFCKMASVCPGGLIIMHLSLWYAPLGRTLGGGVNENFSPALLFSCCFEVRIIPHCDPEYLFPEFHVNGPFNDAVYNIRRRCCAISFSQGLYNYKSFGLPFASFHKEHANLQY